MASIFLVEPHDHIKVAFKRAIGNTKYEIVEDLDSGDAAVLSFKNLKNKPDIVVMDIAFPTGKGGIQIMEQMQKIDPKTKVVLIHDKKSAVRAVEGTKKGAVGHIRYPFASPDKVLAELAKAEGAEKSKGVAAMGSEEHFAHLDQSLPVDVKKQGLFAFLSGTSSGMSESLSVNQIKFMTTTEYKSGDKLSINIRLGGATEDLRVKVQKVNPRGGSFKITGAIESEKAQRSRLRKIIVDMATRG
ncbi:MAG: response regulator [Planctomycetota bacterium]|jgi:DNA-binding NarL/FixJ family response regulator|nr:response regulator [Planctomycetota bacterium]